MKKQITIAILLCLLSLVSAQASDSADDGGSDRKTKSIHRDGRSRSTQVTSHPTVATNHRYLSTEARTPALRSTKSSSEIVAGPEQPIKTIVGGPTTAHYSAASTNKSSVQLASSSTIRPGSALDIAQRRSIVSKSHVVRAVQAPVRNVPVHRTIVEEPVADVVQTTEVSSDMVSSENEAPLDFSYYFRPYQHPDIAKQQNAPFIESRSNPYDNRWFETIYARKSVLAK